jgi:hypothetical protein
MPGKPTEAPPEPAAAGVTFHKYELIGETEGYRISIFRYPKGSSVSLDNAAQILINSPSAESDGSLPSTIQTTLDGKEALEFTIHNKSLNQTSISSLCVIGDSLYLLSYVSPMNRENVTNARVYFESFHVGII